MIRKRMLRVVVSAVALASVATVGTAGSAQAAEIEYLAGKDVVIGSCKGWLNKRTSDGYVQAVAQSWGDQCTFWLERKRLGAGGYSWTTVSDYRNIHNSQLRTGFHWNGTDAGSRVCVVRNSTGSSACGATAW